MDKFIKCFAIFVVVYFVAHTIFMFGRTHESTRRRKIVRMYAEGQMADSQLKMYKDTPLDSLRSWIHNQ